MNDDLMHVSTAFGVAAIEKVSLEGSERLVLVALSGSVGDNAMDAVANLTPVAARAMARDLMKAAKQAEGRMALRTLLSAEARPS